MISRRSFSILAASFALAHTRETLAQQGQAWPTKPIRLIIPFAAGGANDQIARIVTNRLSEFWGQPIVLENKPGAAGSVGAQLVARSDPDGYTVLLMGEVNFAVNPFLYQTKLYDPLADLTPVVRLALSPNIMVVPKSSPAQTVTDFIAYAKSKAGQINFGSSGTGTSVHLSGELFKRLTGIEMTHVPFRGGAPALTEIMAGRIDVMFGIGGTTLPHVQQGTMRALAVTSATRMPQAPQIPTIAESGVPEFDVSAPFALYVPSATPTAIAKKINTDTVAVLGEPAIKPRLEALGLLVEASTLEGLSDQLKADIKRWSAIIKDAGIKASD